LSEDLSRELDAARQLAWQAYGHLPLYGDKALADLGEAIWLEPNSAQNYRYRGDLHRRNGAYLRAFSDFGGVIRLDPKDSSAYRNRGNTLVDLGDWTDSALQWLPAPPKTRLTLTSLISSTFYRLAVRDYNETIRTNAKDANAYRALAKVYEQLGDRIRAEESRRKADELDSTADR
jgi:tetratricopeptide (TPR) repeat protein